MVWTTDLRRDFGRSVSHLEFRPSVDCEFSFETLTACERTLVGNSCNALQGEYPLF